MKLMLFAISAWTRLHESQLRSRFHKLIVYISEIVSEMLAAGRSKKAYEPLKKVAQHLGNHFHYCVRIPRQTPNREQVVRKRWTSAWDHYTGNHEQCLHGAQEPTIQLDPTSSCARKLLEIITKRKKLIASVDPEFSTARLEGHNSVIRRLATKSNHFFPVYFKARTCVAAIHSSENSNREYVVDNEGGIRYSEVVKKLVVEKGTKLKPRRKLPTYDYCNRLVRECVGNEEAGANAGWRMQNPVEDELTIIDQIRANSE